MRRLPTALLTLSMVLAAPARAATVGVPAGASDLVSAPSAKAFAEGFSQLLSASAAIGGPRPALFAHDVETKLGLPLLDAARLASSGVDVDRDWVLFERNGARYLGLWVSDRAALGRAMDAWAASRLLQAREQKPVAKDAVQVTYARAKGTRAACGYLMQGDRAVVLVHPSEREPALDAAMKALDAATPVRAPVEGLVLVRHEAGAWAREAWSGVTASARGLEVSGAARDVAQGWFASDASRAAWVSAPAAGVAEQVLRARLLAGPKLASVLARLATQATGPDDARAAGALEEAATGPMELFVPRLATAWRRTGSTAGELAGLLSPTLVLPGRAASEASIKAVRPKKARFRTGSENGALVVTAGAAASVPPEPAGRPQLACEKGRPVLAASWSTYAASRSLDGISFLEAMGDELLMGLYGLQSEYGPFLKRLPPGVAIACQDGARLTWSARWQVPARAPGPSGQGLR